MGDLVFAKDRFLYRVAPDGITWGNIQNFDPYNPPVISPGQGFMLVPIVHNIGPVGHDFKLSATVTGPARTIEPNWVLDPSYWRPIRAGGYGGYGFYFIADVSGEYVAEIRVYQDEEGNLSDYWYVTICQAEVAIQIVEVVLAARD